MKLTFGQSPVNATMVPSNSTASGPGRGGWGGGGGWRRGWRAGVGGAGGDGGAGGGGAGVGVPEAPACLTVNVVPPTVTAPSRAAPALTAIVTPTAALAVPLAGLDTAIQAAWLAALHWHPVNVVSVNESVPPAAATDASAGAIENVHGAAAWLSGSWRSSMVSAAERADGTGFSETV